MGSNVQESFPSGLNPFETVRFLAEKKAKAVAKFYHNHMVVGADTTVVFKGNLLGKPRDIEAANCMLRNLRAKKHCVVTGLALVDTRMGLSRCTAVSTLVQMRDYLEREVLEYLATGEYADKAGGYAIQGLGRTLVERIEGCYYNVVGLPLCELTSLLLELDWPVNVSELACRLPSQIPCPRYKSRVTETSNPL